MGNPNHKGFTLTELLISISILAVMTTLATANFRAGSRGDELRIASNLTIAAIRRVQTMALAGQTVPICAGGTRNGLLCLTNNSAECSGGGTCSQTVPHAYGISFSTLAGSNTTATTFADLTIGATIGNDIRDAGEDIRSEQIAPGNVVEVSTLAPTSSSKLDIVFEPPKPRVWFNGSSSVASATIQLRHTITGLIKTLQVNAVSGRIGE